MNAIQLKKLEARIHKLNREFAVADRMGWDREALKRRAVNLSRIYLMGKH
jgi:hypothetical protein